AYPVSGFNQPQIQLRRPLPAFGSLPVLQSSGSSIYHALIGRLQRRFGAGFSLLASYTYGNAIDDSTGGNVVQDARNSRMDPAVPISTRGSAASSHPELNSAWIQPASTERNRMSSLSGSTP